MKEIGQRQRENSIKELLISISQLKKKKKKKINRKKTQWNIELRKKMKNERYKDNLN